MKKTTTIELNANFINEIKNMDLRDEVLEWAIGSNYKTQQEAWNDCRYGEAMAWYLAKPITKHGSPEHRHLVLALHEIAKLVKKYIPANKHLPQAVFEKTEAWIHGCRGITWKNVKKARNAAYSNIDPGTDKDNTTSAICSICYAADVVDYSRYRYMVYAARDTVSRAAQAAYITAFQDFYPVYEQHYDDVAFVVANKAWGLSSHASANILRSHYPNPPRRDKRH